VVAPPACAGAGERDHDGERWGGAILSIAVWGVSLYHLKRGIVAIGATPAALAAASAFA
jgi:hypothetical protein